jgi:hypothetical protein
MDFDSVRLGVTWKVMHTRVGIAKERYLEEVGMQTYTCRYGDARVSRK